ncbi:hypothetical protein ACFPN0_00770 [Kitasatospora cinereorecta]
MNSWSRSEADREPRSGPGRNVVSSAEISRCPARRSAALAREGARLGD